LQDVYRNLTIGGEWVTCPACGHAIRHFAAAFLQRPDRTGEVEV
jgi:hypothetical protein